MPPVEGTSERDKALRSALRLALSPAILVRLDEVCLRSRLSIREILAQAIDFAWHVQMSGGLICQPKESRQNNLPDF